MLTQISSILQDNINKPELLRRLKKEKVCLLWEEIVGPKIAEKTKATSFKEGILFVGVASPTWANQLSFLKESLISKINELNGEFIVKDIRFYQEQIIKKIKKEEPEEIYPLVELSQTELKEINDLCSVIDDPELKELLEMIIVKDKQNKKAKEKKGWKKCELCHALHKEEGKVCPFCNLLKTTY